MLDLCDILIAQQKGENQTEKIYFYRTLHNRPVPIVVNVCLLLIYKVYIARDVKHLEIKFLSELKLMCHSHTPQLYIVWFRQLCCCACQIKMLQVRLHTHIESCNHELINLMVVNVVFYFSLLLLLFGYIMLFSSSFCCPFIARSPAASVWPYICAFTYNLSEVSIARSGAICIYIFVIRFILIFPYFSIYFRPPTVTPFTYKQSLGVVLYVLVCGALPFDGPTIQSLRDRVLSGRFRIPFFMSTGKVSVMRHATPSSFIYFIRNTINRTIFRCHLSLCAECESLIRKMLVLDPNRRYTIPQIKQHRWMMCEPRDSVAFLSEKSNAFSRTAYVEPNEQVLRLMAGLGIDVQRTRNSLKVSGRSVVCGHWPSATICGRALFDICSDVKYFFRRRIATIIMRPFICCCWIVSALGRYRRTALSAVLPPQTIRAPIGHRTWT